MSSTLTDAYTQFITLTLIQESGTCTYGRCHFSITTHEDYVHGGHDLSVYHVVGGRWSVESETVTNPDHTLH